MNHFYGRMGKLLIYSKLSSWKQQIFDIFTQKDWTELIVIVVSYFIIIQQSIHGWITALVSQFLISAPLQVKSRWSAAFLNLNLKKSICAPTVDEKVCSRHPKGAHSRLDRLPGPSRVPAAGSGASRSPGSSNLNRRSQSFNSIDKSKPLQYASGNDRGKLRGELIMVPITTICPATLSERGGRGVFKKMELVEVSAV